MIPPTHAAETVPLIGFDVIYRPKPNVQVSYGAMTMAAVKHRR